MPEITIDVSRFEKDMNKLIKRSPQIFEKQMYKWLVVSGEKLRMESLMIAKKEAVGATSHYMQGFKVSQVMKEADGSQFIKVFNVELYSRVVEFGGMWKNNMPPVQNLLKWVNSVLSPGSAIEAQQIAYAIAKSIKKRSLLGERGQKFQRSRKKDGRVLTMTRALKKSKQFIEKAFGIFIAQGISTA